MKIKKVKLLLLVLLVGLVAIIWSLVAGTKSKALTDDLQEQLVHSANFEALSLNPVRIPTSDKFGTNTNTLLGYPILGHVKITDEDLRRKLVNAVSKDIAKPNHISRACILEPREGIRCIDGSNSVQIAICYHCGDVWLERNGKDENYLIKMDGWFLSPASKQLFEKIFKQTGVETAIK